MDQYVSSNIPNLSGCVADAQSMQKYLVDSLAVPMDHILLLTDDNATRQAILQAFQMHFINNDRITKGNTMLFYFAGHGSQFNAPAGWTTDDRKVVATALSSRRNLAGVVHNIRAATQQIRFVGEPYRCP